MQKMFILFFMLAQSGFIEAMNFSLIKNSECNNGKIPIDKSYIYAAACLNKEIRKFHKKSIEYNALNTLKIDGVEFDEQGDVWCNAEFIKCYFNEKDKTNSHQFLFYEDDKIKSLTDGQIVKINTALKKCFPWLVVVNYWKDKYDGMHNLWNSNLSEIIALRDENSALKKSTSWMYRLGIGTVIAAQFGYIFYLKKYK